MKSESTRKIESITELIQDGHIESCKAFLAKLHDSDRKLLAPTALMWFRRLARSRVTEEEELSAEMRRTKCAVLSAFSTASSKQLAGLTYTAVYLTDADLQFLARVRPDGLKDMGTILLNDSPDWWPTVRQMFSSGICEKPDSVSYVLGMIKCASTYPGVSSLRENLVSERDLLEEDIWKLFQVEGNGRISLASQDRKSRAGSNWCETIQELSQEGLIDRSLLLDSCLAALARDFAPPRSAWFSRMHDALEPTLEETRQRAESYMELVSSTVPATVTLAIKRLYEINKHRALAESTLAERITNAIPGMTKATAKTARRLIDSLPDDSDCKSVK